MPLIVYIVAFTSCYIFHCLEKGLQLFYFIEQCLLKLIVRNDEYLLERLRARCLLPYNLHAIMHPPFR